MFLARFLATRAVPNVVRGARTFQGASSLQKDQLPVRPKKIDENDVEESFLKGSGPGGQKINKTSSAVQLRHKPTGIVVKVQDSRSRDLNRVLARRRLAEQLDLAENGENSWIQKKQHEQGRKSAKKSQRSRAKYRKLEQEKLANDAVQQSGSGTQNPA